MLEGKLKLYDYVNEKVATNKVLAYIPTWMTKLDYIELPASIDKKPVIKPSFATGSIDVYILSDNDDMADLQSEILGNQVELSEVALGDAPIVVDPENEEYSELHVYKFTVQVIDANGILAKVGGWVQGKIGGATVAVDASDAIEGTLSDANVSDASTILENNTSN